MTIPSVFSMWTKPETPEQIAFASLHSEEKQAYSIGSTMIQIFWAICDLPAFMAILLSVAEYIPLLLYIHAVLAGAIVFSLHFILKATLKVKLHYMLQSATWSDGVAHNLSWRKAYIPIIISVVLFSCSTAGLFIFEKQNGYKAQIKENGNSELLAETNIINSTYAATEATVEKSYKNKEAATLPDLDRKIANLQAKTPINNWHKGVIAGDIAEAKSKRKKEAKKILDWKTKELDSLTAKKMIALQSASSRFDKQAQLIGNLNDSEIIKQKISENFGSRYSCLISLVLMLLYFGSQTQLSAINFKSGIFHLLPSDNREPLLKKLVEALYDIYYRRGLNAITALHRLGSTATVRNPDGTLNIESSNYNSATVAQQTASVIATEAENAEAVITESQQESERLQQIETERIAAERLAFEAEKQLLAKEIAVLEAKQREIKEEQERVRRERLAELEAKEKAAEADRLKQIETAKEAERQKAQQERNKMLQLERENQEREAKAQQQQKEKDEANRVAQQELEAKLAASDTAKDKMEKIRTDLSNLRHGNGTFESITKRLSTNFEILALLKSKEYLTEKTANKLVERWEEYQSLLKAKGGVL